jgi:hypothetical protein
LQIIGAGFGRTGTNSLKIALEILGFEPCYHMFEVTRNPNHVEFWNSVADKEPVSWRDFFRPYQAAVDWPVSAYWFELFQEISFPKVIITIRDPEEWYESAKSTIFLGMENWDKSDNPETRNRMKMAKNIILDGVFSSQYKKKDHCIKVYENHLSRVRSVVPDGKLLEFDLSKGWVPLCDFLSIGKPEVTFPHTNTRESFFNYKPK